MIDLIDWTKDDDRTAALQRLRDGVFRLSSIAQLADLMDVNGRTMERWISGRQAIPLPAMLELVDHARKLADGMIRDAQDAAMVIDQADRLRALVEHDYD